jgi:F0F1-type ATP synthase membrane subunit b/b'
MEVTAGWIFVCSLMFWMDERRKHIRELEARIQDARRLKVELQETIERMNALLKKTKGEAPHEAEAATGVDYVGLQG